MSIALTLTTDRIPNRLPLGRAHMLAASAVREAQRAGLPIDSIVSVGSLRRYAPEVGDVSLLAVAEPRRFDDVLSGLAALALATATTSRSRTSITVV